MARRSVEDIFIDTNPGDFDVKDRYYPDLPGNARSLSHDEPSGPSHRGFDLNIISTPEVSDDELPFGV